MKARIFAQALLIASIVDFIAVDNQNLGALATLPSSQDQPYTVAEMVRIIDKDLEAKLPGGNRPVMITERIPSINGTAVSQFIYDEISDTALYEKNADEVRPIGSITKLMTSYVVSDMDIDSRRYIKLERSDWRSGAADHLFFGESYNAKDLMTASLVASDNSATIALVRMSGLTEKEFVEKMNEAARGMDLENTHFADPTGLGVQNVSTAKEVAKMMKKIFNDENISALTSTPEAKIKSLSGKTAMLYNTDDLLNSELNEAPYKIAGGKTGYIEEAGYCLGARVIKDDVYSLIVVALGSATRELRAIEVGGAAIWAFEAFRWPDQL